VALEISSSYQVSYSPAATGRSEALDAARGVQQAKTEKQLAMQRRRDAQEERQQAEKRLEQARRNELAAADQVRAAQAEQLRVKRNNQALPAGGEIMSIIV